MPDLVNDSEFVDIAAALLTHYSFDLSGQPVERLIESWATIYPPVWLQASVVEALYQGRYKAISVSHILTIWSRRGHPICHFNLEFERMVCAPVRLETDVASMADELQHIEEAHHSHTLTDLESTQPLNLDECISHHFEKAEQLMHSSMPPAHTVNQPNPSMDVTAIGLGDHEAVNGRNKHAETLLQHSYLPDFAMDSYGDESLALPPFHGLDPQQPIHRFVPQAESSLFYSRLQAIASSVSPTLLPESPLQVSINPSIHPLDGGNDDGENGQSEPSQFNPPCLENVRIPPSP